MEGWNWKLITFIHLRTFPTCTWHLLIEKLRREHLISFCEKAPVFTPHSLDSPAAFPSIESGGEKKESERAYDAWFPNFQFFSSLDYTKLLFFFISDGQAGIPSLEGQQCKFYRLTFFLLIILFVRYNLFTWCALNLFVGGWILDCFILDTSLKLYARLGIQLGVGTSQNYSLLHIFFSLISPKFKEYSLQRLNLSFSWHWKLSAWLFWNFGGN